MAQFTRLHRKTREVPFFVPRLSFEGLLQISHRMTADWGVQSCFVGQLDDFNA